MLRDHHHQQVRVPYLCQCPRSDDPDRKPHCPVAWVTKTMEEVVTVTMSEKMDTTVFVTHTMTDVMTATNVKQVLVTQTSEVPTTRIWVSTEVMNEVIIFGYSDLPVQFLMSPLLDSNQAQDHDRDQDGHSNRRLHANRFVNNPVFALGSELCSHLPNRDAT